MEYLMFGIITVGVLAISHYLFYQYGWMDGYCERSEYERQRRIK